MKLSRTQGLQADKTITVKVTNELDEKTAKAAKRARLSKSEYVRLAIKEKLAQEGVIA